MIDVGDIVLLPDSDAVIVVEITDHWIGRDGLPVPGLMCRVDRPARPGTPVVWFHESQLVLLMKDWPGRFQPHIEKRDNVYLVTWDHSSHHFAVREATICKPNVDATRHLGTPVLIDWPRIYFAGYLFTLEEVNGVWRLKDEWSRADFEAPEFQAGVSLILGEYWGIMRCVLQVMYPKHTFIHLNYFPSLSHGPTA